MSSLGRRPRGERLVLNFHGIGSPLHSIPAEEQPFWCGEERFGALLDTSLEVSHRTSVPIELTFDDGNVSDATIAVPALMQRGLRASFFVCAGRLGQPGYLDEAAVKKIVDSGMEVGSHGWGHIDWRQADEATLDQEIAGARHRLREVAGVDVSSVAIPFGRYNRRVLNRLRSSSFTQIFTSDGGRARMGGLLVTREAYETSWDDQTIEEFAVHAPSVKARLRRAIGQQVRQLR